MIFHAKWLLGYGFFLFICGLAGYLSNPAAAQTALISGSVFGGLSAIWGILLHRCGNAWPRYAAIATCGFLSLIFTWRSWASWMAVKEGDPKVFAAVLISAMLMGTVTTIVVLILRRNGK
jgi:uncharacterized membrane protein (UPF0136 family)